jgi:hypothetical protein
MTVFEAQRFIIVTSLAATGSLLIFYVIGPSIGFPIDYDQSIRLIQINSPVFFGYLGSATQFLFTGDTARARLIDDALAPLLKILVVGPIVVFALLTAASLAAFGISNRQSASPGTGMSVENLSILLTVALGLLAVTTSVIVTYLFSTSDKSRRRRRSAEPDIRS